MPKKVDSKGRWRDRTVTFRVSDEERKVLYDCIKMSGLSKQDYLLSKATNREVVVQGRSPRVYKALRDQMNEIYEELKRLESSGECRDELLETLRVVATTLQGMGDIRL